MSNIPGKTNSIVLTTAILLGTTLLAQSPQLSRTFVSDEGTAIRISEAKLSAIYGKKQIESERPFHAMLKDGIWTVSGSLPEGWVDGVATIRIDQRTGKTISYGHGK